MTASWDGATDVLVVGGGGGGLAAAVSASESSPAQRRLGITLVEKSDRLGGNTSLSSGSVPGAGTRYQIEAGIADNAERFVADIMRTTRDTAPRILAERLAESSAPLVEWLVEDLEIPLELLTDLRKVGHSVSRIHAPRSKSGQTLVDGLEAKAISAGVDIALRTPVTDLIVDDGVIVGALLGGASAGMRIKADAIVLACNGFGANRRLLEHFIPEIADAPYFGHTGNTGDPVEWAGSLGLRLCHMGAYQGHASVSHPHGALMTWVAVEKGGVLVNRAGHRFVDESKGYSGCSTRVLEQPDALAYVLFDEHIHDYLCRHFPDYLDLTGIGGCCVEEPGDEPGSKIAQRYGIDPEALRATIAAAFEAPGLDRQTCPFGRIDFGDGPLRPPLVGVQVTAGLFHTQGGIDVDRHARAMRTTGEPVPNLYAVGGTAVGISGDLGCEGYLSANGLLAALALGRIAGRHARESCGSRP
jgi:fumarate reductase flavoprotein subunit